MNPLDRFYYERSGPLAKARVCRGCGHVETVMLGGRGRGYGMRVGNQARGRIIQHVKHCSQVAKLIEADA